MPLPPPLAVVVAFAVATAAVTTPAVAAPAPVPAPSPAPAARCALEGWSNDPDPAGLIVRAGPAITAREIGRLPPAVDADDRYAPEFDILDVQNGWARIANANDNSNPNPDKPRPVFKGTGWVHASRVSFTLQTTVGRAAPGLKAPVLVASDAFAGDAAATAMPLVGCRGGWAQMRYRLPAGATVIKGPRAGVAWFGAVCGNQHTTCDGLSEEKTRPGR